MEASLEEVMLAADPQERLEGYRVDTLGVVRRQCTRQKELGNETVAPEGYAQ